MEEEEAGNGAVKDWRETAFSDAPARTMKHESWAPQKEVSNFQEAAESEEAIRANVKEAPMAGTKLEPYTVDAWAAALNQKTSVEAATIERPAPTAEAEEERVEPVVHEEAGAGDAVHAKEMPEPKKPEGDNSWFSAVSSPWDAEVQKASKLASTWDAPGTSAPAAELVHENGEAAQFEARGEAPKDDPAATVDGLIPELGEEAKEKAAEAILPAATVEAIREEAQQQIAETAAQTEPEAEAQTKADESSMDDMVAKVLSKMSPEMLQAVTREILKPVVEAMVRDELNAKK